MLDEMYQRMDSKGFYKLDIPEKLNMARLIVDFWVEHGRALDVAIYYHDQKITYQELKELMDRFANALHKLGVSKGDRYVIRTPNQPEYQISFLGGLKIGAVPIPTNTMLREYELEHIINNSETVAVITTSEYTQALEIIRPKCKTLKHVIVIGETEGDQISFEEILKEGEGVPPFVETHKDDQAYFLYTSGTTGPPKG
ncbi:MAG: AMP-binding protein, partial [Desulfatiglandales bacterium]|nr:AMP-binding protein [Desulfatiglandales bacterium]